MLAKKNRLNLDLTENSVIFSKGGAKVVGSEFLLAYFRPNDQRLLSSCLIPKAIFSKASQRNYYRRLLYSFLEQAIEKNVFSLTKKIDLVILLKKNFRDTISNSNLEKDFQILLKKIKND